MRRATALARSRSPDGDHARQAVDRCRWRCARRRRRPRTGSPRAPARRSPPGRSSSSCRRRRTASARRSSPSSGASGTPPPQHEPGALLLALLDVAEHPLAAASSRPAGPWMFAGVGRVAVADARRRPPSASSTASSYSRAGHQQPGGHRAALAAVDAHRSTRAARWRPGRRRRARGSPTCRRARGTTGFSVAAAASMMRRPVAVEPVKATMSTIGRRR